MSRQLKTGIIIALIAGKDWIYDDAEDSTISEVFGLNANLFKVPNKHLTEHQRESLNLMLEAVGQAPSISRRYSILEGKAEGWAAGRAALKVWFEKSTVSQRITQKVDKALEECTVSPAEVIARLADGSETIFPNISECDTAKEDIVIALFGHHAGSRISRGDFKDAVHIIVHHQWERHRKCFNRAKKAFPNKRDKARTAVKAIEESAKVTTKQLRAAIKAVNALKESLKWLPCEQHMDNGPDEMEEFLKTIVVTTVAKVKNVSEDKLEVSESKSNAASEYLHDRYGINTENVCVATRGRTRARKVKIGSLAAAGDIDEIWALYVQLFELTATESEEMLLDLEGESGREEWDGNEDLGVGTFAKTTDEALNGMLNFHSGRPTLFARFRSRSGKSSWDDEASAGFKEGNADMQELSLLWHQRVGVAAIVEKIWLPEAKPEGVAGMLIADEVGVGKTGLTMGTIAFTIHAYWCQELAAGRRRPDGGEVDLTQINIKPAPILGE
ncbi:hypothetical protein AZE42_13280 [Rhizopogon vesiculosus]|uniref:SNF2 N-terminal domain-containing protein n=1 Tax=Rhizopogon vesiculosus TaxID=180088 RepID=A0A1J8R7Z8_9AGAM|nr:hypothetical protein AZE42_13280 [Rhizopogon vesiculosus]